MSPSPSRRKSIAVTHQVDRSRPAHKRRPHSITPGDSVLKQLSPVSRARRSIGPRKSILKARPSLAPEDADDTEQTMDFTRDFRGQMGDNTSRKSLGRRVSFASHAQVRVFEKDLNKGDAPPSPSKEPSGPSAQPGVIFNDENDYPGASATARRRSSFRRSSAFSENGEAPMDMDSEFESSPLPAGFLAEGSFLQDEELDDVSERWDSEADMELTTNLPALRSRKSSLGLSALPPPDEDEDISGDDLSPADMTLDSAVGDSPERPEPTEFTVPLNKSLRKSEPPSAEWLALRAMTHAGEDTPYEAPPSDMDEEDSYVQANSVGLGEDDMDLTEAETRLRRMRESLGLTNVPQEDSFTSSEGSSFSGGDNQTINLTNAWRASLGGADSNSTMELTTIQSTSVDISAEEAINRSLPSVQSPEGQPGHPGSEAIPSSSEPAPAAVPAASSTASSDLPAPPPAQPVFSRPGPVFSAPKKVPPSPSKLKSPASPRKGGTAAFALPTDRSQPKKRPAPDVTEEGSSSLPVKQPSPIKRPAPTGSPSKGGGVSVHAEPKPPVSQRPSIGGLRRPSGYFAQRRSLGPSGLSNIPQAVSPKKKAAQARSSIASVTELDQNSAINFGRENLEPSLLAQDSQAAMENSLFIPEGDMPQTRASPPFVPPPSAGTDSAFSFEPEALVAPQPINATIETDATEQWRSNVQPPSFTDEDEGPPISIEQFFTMTSIRFLDKLSAPRRSTILPSQLQSGQRRSSLPGADVPLSDYVIAMAIDDPQLELYSHVAADLQRWIEHSKEIYHQAEEEATKVTPMLFREYATADEQTQAELLQQLKLIKANNHAAARSQWYDWRLQWVEQLYSTAEQNFTELEQDASTLESIIQQAQSVLPSLREEHARVMKELEEEQVIAAEIENCDQDYLNELKATLAEQGAALDEFRTEVAEANAKLERLEEKQQDIEKEKAEAKSSIDAAQRILHVHKNSTQAEAFRLRDELASLEDLHLWHASKVHTDLFEFVYASRFEVRIPSAKFKPLKDQIQISKTKDMPLKFKDQFPRFTDLAIKVAQQRLATSPSELGVRQIVESLGDFWSGCSQLRTHFTFLSIKYPITVEAQPPRGDGETPGLVTTATVLLPSVKAKLLVSFLLDTDTLWEWPMTIGRVDCRVRKAYGPDFDTDKIRTTILQRMARATPDDNHACFLDACIEATVDYEVANA
ncbi:Spc7 kinetochore protein-domain-containing protein [Gloeopeniophorella convolvens]|nr:Spc7 kinetochore protein-domain-containing protein [Gloeopeniophorella convolvens]